MMEWDLQYLGVTYIPPNLSMVEIEHFFTLRPAELEVISKSRGASIRLGLALHAGFLRFSGGLLNSTDLIPEVVPTGTDQERDFAASKTLFLNDFNSLDLKNPDFTSRFNGLLIVTFCTNQPRTPFKAKSRFLAAQANILASRTGSSCRWALFWPLTRLLQAIRQSVQAH